MSMDERESDHRRCKQRRVEMIVCPSFMSPKPPEFMSMNHTYRNPKGKKLGDRHRFEFDKDSPSDLLSPTDGDEITREVLDFGKVNPGKLQTRIFLQVLGDICREFGCVNDVSLAVLSATDEMSLAVMNPFTYENQAVNGIRKGTLYSLDRTRRITAAHVFPASEEDARKSDPELFKKNNLPRTIKSSLPGGLSSILPKTEIQGNSCDHQVVRDVLGICRILPFWAITFEIFSTSSDRLKWRVQILHEAGELEIGLGPCGFQLSLQVSVVVFLNLSLRTNDISFLRLRHNYFLDN
ncbi:hypothetical protein ARMSODRAFT_982917 [Armillaria solidipes]|uniref:Uncharacterized protein n=1 Tax=Armillaria solidipes TaxID=1076256 RepID=A0A2H3B0W5_9AGAR|nr:hypothetical protein ARMSODRAFT_982917 [Armillaria solidipes]